MLMGCAQRKVSSDLVLWETNFDEEYSTFGSDLTAFLGRPALPNTVYAIHDYTSCVSHLCNPGAY